MSSSSFRVKLEYSKKYEVNHIHANKTKKSLGLKFYLRENIFESSKTISSKLFPTTIFISPFFRKHIRNEKLS